MHKLITLMTMLAVAAGAWADETTDASSETTSKWYVVGGTEEDTVGLSDLSTAWWGDMSSAYYLTKDSTLTLNFTNYSNKQQRYNNFSVVVTTNCAEADRYTEGNTYEEYCVLRADANGWGTGYNSANLRTWNISSDSATFCNDMDSAKVKVKVAYVNDTTAVITTISTTTEGKILQQQVPVTVADDTLRVFLTVKYAYLDSLTSSMSDSVDISLEYEDGGDARLCDYAIGGIEYTAIGETDFSTSFNTTFSSGYNIPEGKSIKLNFNNYTVQTGNYQNFYVYIGSRDTKDQYIVLRADAYGWGASYGTLVTTGFDWSNNGADFRANMDSANVSVIVSNNGATGYFMTTATSYDGDVIYTQEMTFTISDPDDFVARLSIEGAYLTDITSKLVNNYVEIDYSKGENLDNTSSSDPALVDSDDPYNILFTNIGSSYQPSATINNTYRWGWDLSDIDVEDYEWLVIVPRKPHLGESGYIYGLVDESNNIISGWCFAYGYWQRHRTTVYHLTDNLMHDYYYSTETSHLGSLTNSDTVEYYDSYMTFDSDSNEVAKFDFGTAQTFFIYRAEGTADSTYEVSAIFLTNEKPYYDNSAWESTATYAANHKRTATLEGTYGTVCLPYKSAVCGAYIYDVVGYGTDNSGDPSEVYLEEVKGILEAGKAYLYISNTSKTYIDSTNTYSDQWGGDVLFTAVTGAEVSEATEGNGLVGNLSSADITVEEDDYILFVDSVATTEGGTDSTAVYKWGKGTGNTVGQYRAYLDLSVFPESTDEETANAKGWIRMSLASDGDDDATGIREIVSEEESVIDDDAIYNLSGVRVANPQKGIYIKNGKKYIIK